VGGWMDGSPFPFLLHKQERLKERKKERKKDKVVVVVVVVCLHTLCGLAILHFKKYLIKAKEESWKLKYFTMQKYT
jgi:hypothetical protein